MMKFCNYQTLFLVMVFQIKAVLSYLTELNPFKKNYSKQKNGLDDESDCYDEDLDFETNFENFDNQLTAINNELLDDTDSELSMRIDNEPLDDYAPNLAEDRIKNI